MFCRMLLNKVCISLKELKYFFNFFASLEKIFDIKLSKKYCNTKILGFNTFVTIIINLNSLQYNVQYLY